MSPARRRPYQPDEENIFVTTEEARKLVQIDIHRKMGEIAGFWVTGRNGTRPRRVFRLSDVVALRGWRKRQEARG